jgi:hypothetical protein
MFPSQSPQLQKLEKGMVWVCIWGNVILTMDTLKVGYTSLKQLSLAVVTQHQKRPRKVQEEVSDKCHRPPALTFSINEESDSDIRHRNLTYCMPLYTV